MIKTKGILILILSVSINLIYGQAATENKRVYSTTGGEIIFSWADVTKNGKDASVVTRFSPVFNLQYQLHRDFSDHFGLFSGLTIHNVGFIYNDPDSFNTRYKERSYTLGIPLSLKAGNMNGFFLLGGYEIELPFNFKEKKFVNEDKVQKSTDWFSKKTPGLYQAVFFGFQTPYGTQLKFKYYLTNFLNKDYAANDGSGNTIYPYQNIDAKVFYVSLSFQIFTGTNFYYDKK